MELDFKILTREDIPCWYEIGFDKVKKRLLYRIHKDYVKYFPLKNDNHMVLQYMREKKFKSFAVRLDDDFGAERCFRNKDTNDDFIEFAVEIPQIKHLRGECPNCKGTGKDKEMYREKCLYCNGTGKKIEMRWRNAVNIAITLQILNMGMHFGHDNDKTTTSNRKQLITLDTAYGDGMHGGSLSGDVSPAMANWLETLGDEYHFTDAEEEIKWAEHRMFGTDPGDTFRMHEVDAFVRGTNRLCISCPGDRTCIHPIEWYYQKGQGYEWSCHNVDSPAQQLELIIGLAVICDLARKDGI